jgi:hypothetical protein
VPVARAGVGCDGCDSGAEKAFGHLNDNIVVIRNALDWDLWADVVRPSRRGFGLATWARCFGGVATSMFCGDVLGPWLAMNPDVEFVAAGDPGCMTISVCLWGSVCRWRRHSFGGSTFLTSRRRSTLVGSFGEEPVERGQVAFEGDGVQRVRDPVCRVAV